MDKTKAKALARASMARAKCITGYVMLWSMATCVACFVLFNIFAQVTGIVPKLMPTSPDGIAVLIAVGIVFSTALGVVFGAVAWAMEGVPPDIGVWQLVGLVMIVAVLPHAGIAIWRWWHSLATNLDTLQWLAFSLFIVGLGCQILGRSREKGIELF